MLEMLRVSLHTIDIYNGSYVLFLLALLYILFSKKEKEQRFLAIYVVLALCIFFHPICTKIIVTYCIEQEVYWRYLWIIPIGILISYAGARMIEQLDGIAKKYIILLISIGAIVISGKSMYHSANFQLAENFFKLPQEAIEICTVIRQVDIQGVVALPEGLRYYIRQYDAGIEVLYSRLVYHTDELILINELEKEQPDIEVINSILEGKGCRCVVLNRNPNVLGEMEALGYQEVGATENYLVLYK